MHRRLLVAAVAASAATLAAAPPLPQTPPSVDARVEGLLSRMTLEEKVGQMNMPCVYEDGLGGSREAKVEGVRRCAAGRQVDPRTGAVLGSDPPWLAASPVRRRELRVLPS